MSDAMSIQVTVVPTDKLIGVNGQIFDFKKNPFETIPGHENLHALQYKNGEGELELDDDHNQYINHTLYDEEVAPYVAIWQAEKDRLDAEKAAEEAEYNSLENVKARKLQDLNSTMNQLFSTGHMTSSLGFEINADEAANRNITGLITSLEATGEDTVAFMGYDNTLHQVSLADLKTMQMELIVWAQEAYARKWTLRAKVEACTTKEQVDAITWDSYLNDTSEAA